MASQKPSQTLISTPPFWLNIFDFQISITNALWFSVWVLGKISLLIHFIVAFLAVHFFALNHLMPVWVLVFDNISLPILLILPFLPGNFFFQNFFGEILTTLTFLNCTHKSHYGQTLTKYGYFSFSDEN